MFAGQFLILRLGLRIPASRIAILCRGLVLNDAASLLEARAGLWQSAAGDFDLVLRYALRPEIDPSLDREGVPYISYLSRSEVPRNHR